MPRLNPTTVAQIRDSLARLIKPGDVHELRILTNDYRHGNVSGYFDNLDLMAQAAAQWDGRSTGVYFTLNPVHPALLARYHNRLQEKAKTTTSDHEIQARRWLPLDFDPVRPAGVSSSDPEHEAALDRAEQCAQYLWEEGWPKPIFIDSGNGAHLLYPINDPNEEASKEWVKAVLDSLSKRFSDDLVKLDTAVYNASRIWKVPGTLAGKGDSIPQRPHRRSYVIGD